MSKLSNALIGGFDDQEGIVEDTKRRKEKRLVVIVEYQTVALESPDFVRCCLDLIICVAINNRDVLEYDT